MKKTVLFKAGLASLSALMMLAQPTFANDTIHFSNCTEAWENGYSDIHRGEPGYSSRLDKDGDGVACERSKAPRGVFKPRQSHSQSSRTTSGWVNRDGAWYYLKSDGSYVTNSWQGNYYLKSDGKMAKNEWLYDNVYQGWYYLKSDGTYAKNSWQGDYYLKSDGKMAKSEWIYDGVYQGWYYLKSDGSYAKNSWQGNYYLKSDGKMAKSEWIYDGGYQGWYYLKSDGSYAKNSWQGNYYLKSDGKMAKSEWIYDGGYQGWYYLKSDGSYAKSSWQGNYYLKSDGKMAKNEWVDGGRYFVGSDGLWQNHSVSQSSSNQTKTDYTNALEKAKNYNSWANMSKKRLYKQLTS
ncbi:excalibur calcium-binding domain-containing protein [Streptococcus sp. D7B5]|uniref:excalibur calcium-binding domain-containing protein n=1 Tax=Streptococcus sp. D7B5 TaxID=3038077 RepID=UPI00241E6E95|nr:excalibur calcium-binding domain-containing protein [Streptococcus sp. D7B5]WFR88030.1 excalibur calcium-binding domain-containing protein [Streptococcus sp. D7B5]